MEVVKFPKDRLESLLRSGRDNFGSKVALLSAKKLAVDSISEPRSARLVSLGFASLSLSLSESEIYGNYSASPAVVFLQRSVLSPTCVSFPPHANLGLV